jgi:transcriptional regulator with XRE-family HTH domain
MPPSAGSPAVRRRRLAAELRRLRGGRTGNQVATGLGWSPSKISRYELGRSTLPLDEVERLLDFYGVSGRERSQLLSLARDANQRGWWEDYTDALPEELQAFIGLEAEAATVSQWQVELVPGLLQTERYARQVHLGYQSVVPVPPGVLERRVKVRMLRQKALTREPPLQLRVVIDESVLLRRIGDRELMHAQLQHLAEVANLSNVDLRVLPLADDRAILGDSFVIFSFADGGETAMLHDVVSIDSVVRSELYVEGETDTFLHRLVFQSLVDSSLSPEASQELIQRTAERVWT